MLARQLGLLAPSVGFDASFAGLVRHDLGHGAWVDHLPGWLCGHEDVFEALYRGMDWKQRTRWMYEREVEEPRLTASVPRDGPGHPMFPAMGAALSRRYGSPLTSISLGLYRDGRDSVALHGDVVLREGGEGLVATVSVGEPRRFLVKPKDGPSLRFDLGWGDLCVMGGTCQHTCLHGIPKVARALPRVAIMFRVPDPRKRAAQ